MSVPPIRVMVVDDNADIALMMRLRLGMEPDIACESFTNVDEAVRRLEDGASDERVMVVLLDWSIPGCKGEESIRRVGSAAPGVRVVVFSGYDEAEIGAAAWEAGAWRCVSKDADFERVVRAIREVAAGPAQ